jgi:hypothetical protein
MNDFTFKADTDDDLVFFVSGLLMAGMFLYHNNFREYLIWPPGFPIIFLVVVSLIIFYATFISLKSLRANKIL